MTTARLSLLLGLTALFACGDKAEDTARDSGHDHADPDADTDTDTDADTDADTGGGDATAGETIYAASCGSDYCHGSDGVSGSAPDHPEVVPARTDDELRTIITQGQGGMGPQNLDATQTEDVIAYLRLTFP